MVIAYDVEHIDSSVRSAEKQKRNIIAIVIYKLKRARSETYNVLSKHRKSFPTLPKFTIRKEIFLDGTRITIYIYFL